MRLALTAGGTGGHIIPALAVLDALRQREGLLDEVRFFGPADRGERAPVEARGIPFEEVPAAGVRGRGPLRLAKSSWLLALGIAIAWRKLRSFAPDAVFSTGGYASFPCSVAAKLLRRPLVVYLPDVTPGWAVRAEKRLATRIATTTEAALQHLPRRKTVVTGYPVRRAFFDQTRDEARATLGIEPGDRVVVIAGASQGARAVNRAIFEAAESLCRQAIVFHVTGSADHERAVAVARSLQGCAGDRYRVAAFRDDLPTVMLASDLGVFRAGASVLGEIPAAALPSILVPGRYAGGHQRDNARWLERAGAAVVVEEDALGSLPGLVDELLGNASRLAGMRAAAASLARPGAADAIADLIVQVARR